VMKPKPCSSS